MITKAHLMHSSGELKNKIGIRNEKQKHEGADEETGR